jgi:hypothetical protein
MSTRRRTQDDLKDFDDIQKDAEMAVQAEQADKNRSASPQQWRLSVQTYPKVGTDMGGIQFGHTPASVRRNFEDAGEGTDEGTDDGG